MRARAYDLVLNGNEIAGGSIRIHRPDVQARVFAAIGLSAEDARAKFGFLLDAFKYGPPPHGGIAAGVDRLAMLLSGAESLRDVIAFPKTQKGTDLCTDAPGPVSQRQLDELHIALEDARSSRRDRSHLAAAALGRLADEAFDVLVVGAGATGAAIARDAALRGLSVALCDRGDFAGETSSHSSKLIHGGLRYLEHGHLPLVFEALAERRRLMVTARPPVPAGRVLLPRLPRRGPVAGQADHRRRAVRRPGAVAPAGPQPAAGPGAALPAGAAAAHGRAAGGPRLRRLPDRRRPPGAGERARRRGGRRGGAVLRRARARPVGGGGHGHRLLARDREAPGAPAFAVRARAVVNATGPFSDAFRGGGRALRPTLGVHMVVDAARLPTGGRAFVIRSPRDDRIMFVLPAGPRTIVGTTDTDWPPTGIGRHRPATRSAPAASDVAYLLEAANHAFPAGPAGPDGRDLHLRRPAAAAGQRRATPRPPRASTPSGWTARAC